MNKSRQKLRVAIYCRLSEEDRNKQSEEDDSNSIQNQKSMLIKYADDNDWDIYSIYSDDDYTGSDRNRPDFNRLLKDAEDRKFDIVLCKTQSRFTRELELVEKYIHGLFPIWGIRFISIVDNADTDNKGNKKSRQINGLVNEWYLEDMSENIKSVLTDRRKNGYHIGAFALYGYKKDPKIKGHLIIDEEAAKVVRKVFELFSKGYGKSTIAKMLNDRGIPNPTEYKRLNGLRYKQPKSKNSTLWKYFSISDMLVNEIYIGNMVQGKYGSVSYKTKKNKPRPKEEWYVVKNTHEAIIDIELWDKVQNLIEQKTKPFITGEIGLFAKKVRCINCGYAMRSCKAHGNRYLKCSTRKVATNACIGSFISIPNLEKKVIEELNKLSNQHLNKKGLEENVSWNADIEEKKKILKNDNKMYQKKIEEYSKGLRELYIDKIKGVITENDYIVLSKDFNSERERLEGKIKENIRAIEEIEEKMQHAENLKKKIEQYTNLEHLNREIVDELIDYISVDRRNPETKKQQIEIHWNF